VAKPANADNTRAGIIETQAMHASARIAPGGGGT